MMRLVLSMLALSAVLPALAHDHGNGAWINLGNYKSPIDGSHCCGPKDCFEIPAEEVGTNARGYLLVKFSEVVPYSEAQNSQDGKFWRCKFPDGRRRCFFAPPPNT